MRLRSFVSCLLFLLFATGLFADEDPVPTTQYFGVGGGIATGIGLSYRSWDGPWGWQVSALPIYQDSFQLYSVGASGLVTLNDARWSRFYLYGGAALLGGGFSGALDWNGQAGVGIGIEFVIFDHLAIDLQGGLGAMSPLPLSEYYYWGPIGSAALYYRM